MRSLVGSIIALFFLAQGCEVFLTEAGGEDQPCFKNGKCKPGLVCVDDVCKPAEDPCDPDPCNGHGTCSGGTCSCNTGYTGTACDSCASGYTGYPKCVSSGSCDPDPCNGHGTCSGGTCSCDTGYDGAACDQCDPLYTNYSACDQCSTFGEYPDCFLPGAGFCDTSQCFLVPPTNQNNCYNTAQTMTCTTFPCNADGTPDFCGQDAQYQDNDRVFTCYNAGGTVQDPCDSTSDPDEVVTDSLTGLMWQRTWASDLTWQQAVDYCDNLVYAGYDDWRLPTPFELQSIVDDGTYSPAIDNVAFSGAPASWFWSSSSNSLYTAEAWYVFFDDGQVGSKEKSITSDARCVRSGPSFTGSDGDQRYHLQEPVAGEVVVYDTVTGLLWQKNYETGKTWQEALSYCEGLDYAGHDDWRLPNKKELMSLVNYLKSNPASDFPDLPSNWFWSSSTYAPATSIAWDVDFVDGNVNNTNDKSNIQIARCVRLGETGT